MTTTCKARRVSDQMSCATCGLIWDVNDPEPPMCGLDAEQSTNAHDRAIHDIGEVLKDD